VSPESRILCLRGLERASGITGPRFLTSRSSRSMRRSRVFSTRFSRRPRSAAHASARAQPTRRSTFHRRCNAGSPTV
jgi:hypothetical protein